MAYNLNRKLKELTMRHRQHRTWLKVLGAMCCVMVFCVTYALILPAVTLDSSGPYCGETAHQHISSCFDGDGNLVCDLSEHTHTLACYSDSTADVETADDWEATFKDVELTGNYALDLLQIAKTQLGYEESTRNYIVVDEDDEAAGNGYGSSTTGDVLEAGTNDSEDETVSGTAETEAVTENAAEAAQTETEAAVTEVQTEVETSVTEASTEATEPATESETEVSIGDTTEETTGEISEDTTEVTTEETAEEPTGETENSVPEDDLSGVKKGYTRYGAWYGMPYEDWCGMFVSFCLNYAEVPTSAFPQDASCTSWISTLNTLGLYHSASSDYTAQPGDLVFFDLDGDGTSDHVGIVAGYSDSDLTGSAAEKVLTATIKSLQTAVEDDEDAETETGSYLVTVEGNSDDKVQMVSYSVSSSDILGYGQMAESDEAAALLGSSVMAVVEDDTEEEETEGYNTVVGSYPNNYNENGAGYSGFSYTFTVQSVSRTGKRGDVLTPDDNGIYNITSGDGYYIKFTAYFDSLSVGTYTFQLPTQFTYGSSSSYYKNGTKYTGTQRDSQTDYDLDDYDYAVIVSSTGLVTFLVKTAGVQATESYEYTWAAATYSYSNDDDNSGTNVFSVVKSITTDPTLTNDYVAGFTVVVNQIHEYFSNSLVVYDEMENMAYIPRSMVIVATGTDGSETTLDEGTDYSVTFDSSKGALTITIYNPGDNQYTLTYNAYVVEVSGGSYYGNNIGNEVTGGYFGSSTNTFARYAVYVAKTDADTGYALAGATFALYQVDSETGNETQINTATTDTSGQVVFATGVNDIEHFAYQHTLYYIQETGAPAGYSYDEDTKYYFWFCDGSEDDEEECETCAAFIKELDTNAKYQIIYESTTDEGFWTTTYNVTNKYSATGELELGLKKSYNAWTDMGTDKSFTFRLGTTSGAPLPSDSTIEGTRDSDGATIGYASVAISGSDAANTSDGASLSATFGKITFTSAGKYYYYLTEIRSDSMPSGVTISGVRQYDITVVATDNGDGTLTVAVTEISYTDEDGNAVTVTLDYDEDSGTYSVTTTTVASDGTTTTKAEATTATSLDSVFTFAFENTFEADIQARSILGYKTFSNPAQVDTTNWDGESFSFLFTAITKGAPVASTSTDGETWTVSTTSRTFVSGNLTFTSDMVGTNYYYSIEEQVTVATGTDNEGNTTYTTYTVSELAALSAEELAKLGVTVGTDGSVTYNGITYDPTVIYVQMTPTYQNEYIDSISYDGITYSVDSITYNGKTYTYSSTNDNNAGLSYYICENADGTLETLTYNPGTHAVTVNGVTETLETVEYTYGSTTITYTVGTGTYTDADGKTIDSSKIETSSQANIVVIDVKYGDYDEETGFEENSSYSTDQETAGGDTTRALFQNKKTVTEASEALTGTKTLAGRTFEDGDTFTFDVTKLSWYVEGSGYLDTSETPMPDFEITYTDSSGDEVTVAFTSIKITYHAAAEATEDTEATSAYFTVSYLDSSGNEVWSYNSETAVTTDDNKDGSVAYSVGFDFGTVTFEKVGVYTYTLTEASGSASNMSYDSTTWRVVYTVVDNGDGTLGVTVTGVTATTDDETGDTSYSVSWTNAYRYVAWGPEITKMVTDTSSAGVTETFTFGLYARGSYPYDDGEDTDTGDAGNSTGTLTGEPLQTAELKWSGISGTETVKFSELEFTTATTYTYYIQEIVPESKTPGMTYDESIIQVDVNVRTTDAGGLYVYSVTYTNLSSGDYVVITYDTAGEVESTTYYTKDADTGEYVSSSTANGAATITNVYTVSNITIRKVDATNTNIVLEGTSFRLYQTVDNVKYYYSYDEDTGKVTWVTDEDTATTLTSDESGLLTFHNLLDGTYYLEETKAPNGYNLLSNAVTITIVNGEVAIALNGSSSLDVDTTDGATVVTVPNSSGAERPLTGGAGTTLFTIFGLLLTLGAGILLIARRRGFAGMGR